MHGFVKQRRGPLAKIHNLWAPYNSNAPEPNFTKRGCEGSLDTAVIPAVLVFPEFLVVSAQQPYEDGGVWIFAPKMDVLSSRKFCGTDFHGVPPLTNDTGKTSFGEDLVIIRPAVAKQSRQKSKKHRTATKM